MAIISATPQHAKDIAYLTNLAGEGLAAYLWSQNAAAGQNPLAVGIEKARRPEGNFSYTNAWIMESQGQPVGMLLAMEQPNPPELPDFDGLPEQVVPLIELEALAPGSFYINAIGVYEQYQGHGFGKVMMQQAESLPKARALTELSLIVASENPTAKALYDFLGYSEVARRPTIPFPGMLHGGDWILMTKSIG